jgi:phage gp37-like protein
MGYVSMGTWTQTVAADGPAGSGFTKSLKVECTTADAAPAAGDIVLMDTRLEGQDLQGLKKGTAQAQEITVSFWVKSNVTGTYIFNLTDGDNNRMISAPYTVAASGTWEKKVLTFPGDTTGVLDNDNGTSLFVRWWLGAGSNNTSGTLNTSWDTSVTANRAVGQTNLAAATSNYWQLTGVQLEVGPVATPFEFKPFGQELAECQRYYYRVVGGNAFRLASGHNTSTQNASFVINFPTTMRISPTALEQSGTAADYAVTHGNFTVTNANSVPSYLQSTSNNGAINLGVASGLTTGQGSLFMTNNTNAFLAWSVEL